MAAEYRFTKSGWRKLLVQVGEGNLTGKLIVDQVYAKYQHERPELVHPRGGMPFYLREPFQARHANYLRRVAKAFLDGDPERAMAECMEDLNGAMSAAAPIQFNNLRRSGNPQVHSRGRKVYDRKPAQRRLSSMELRQLRRGRGRR
jgi:hypothetical protein